MIQSTKDIDPKKIVSQKEFQETVYVLLNIIEDEHENNEQLTLRVRELEDEISRLKGGNARPVIKGSKKPGLDISSQGKEKGNSDKVNKETERAPLPIDKEIKVEMSKSDLPADAVFKGYKEYIQQDILVKRVNKRFSFAIYYSASEGKYYKGPFPAGECEGHFGAGVRSLVNTLHHYGNVTQSALNGLLKGFGVRISSGSVSNLLQAEHDWAVKEQSDILRAGLAQAVPKQMDSTGNRENGVNKTTHIITAPMFSAFYTLDSKSRINCLNALQGNPGPELKLQWDDNDVQTAGVSKPDCSKVMGLLKETGSALLSISAFEDLLKSKAPDIYKKKKIVHILSEAMALNYYRQQSDFPPLEVLLSDDAPEYGKIASNQALCWIHDARYYNKLQPQIGVMKDKLESFKTIYWDFYQKLLDYKRLPATAQQNEKEKIAASFDQIFGHPTCYGALDLCIERTKNNKEKLLQVLDFPNLPLHNNAAELAARRVVRKRDISLHTMTKEGTELRDAFLTIIETTKKLGISAYEYINDKIAGLNNMPSLADLIRTLFPHPV